MPLAVIARRLTNRLLRRALLLGLQCVAVRAERKRYESQDPRIFTTANHVLPHVGISVVPIMVVLALTGCTGGSAPNPSPSVPDVTSSSEPACSGVVTVSSSTGQSATVSASASPEFALHLGDHLSLEASGRCASDVRFSLPNGVLRAETDQRLIAQRSGTARVVVIYPSCRRAPSPGPSCVGGISTVGALSVTVISH
jgi:hypothetical protein